MGYSKTLIIILLIVTRYVKRGETGDNKSYLITSFVIALVNLLSLAPGGEYLQSLHLHPLDLLGARSCLHLLDGELRPALLHSLQEGLQVVLRVGGGRGEVHRLRESERGDGGG